MKETAAFWSGHANSSAMCLRMKEMSLTHLSVFSGIGGIDIAGEWAGFHTIGQVEKADYPFRGALQELAGCAKMEGCL